jgi:hypothetical protein
MEVRKMSDFKRSLLLLVCLLLCACTSRKPGIPQQKAEALAWQALQPYTSSKNRANWNVYETRFVRGDTLPFTLQNKRDETCFRMYFSQLPSPENIQSTIEYWLIEFVTRPATPQGTPYSVTAPPNIPEPFIISATLLIDATNGEVAAFRLSCVSVIY